MRHRLVLIAFVVTAGIASGDPARAQGESVAALVQKNFAEVHGWVTKAAEMVPADKYAYRPVSTVRTFGEQVAHIADAYVYFCAHATGRDVEWSDAVEKGATDKATITQKLAAAGNACSAAYAGAGPGNAAPLLSNNTHANLHYGNIVTYMRMMGLVPPSS